MPKFYESETLKRVQETEMDILKDFIQICQTCHLTYFATAGTGLGAVRHGGFIPWDDDIDVCLPRKDFDILIRKIEEEYGEKYYVLDTAHDLNYPLMSTRICKKGTRFQEELLADVDCPFGIFLDVYAYDNIADDPVGAFIQTWMAWGFSKLMILRSIPHPYLGFSGWREKGARAICVAVHYGMKWLRISPGWLYRCCKYWCTRYNHRKTARMGYLCDTSPHWNTVVRKEIYPLIELPFEDIRLKFPQNLHQVLVRFYGPDYMQLPPVEKRKTHYPRVLEFGEE